MAEINIEKMAQNVAEKALDEFLYQGKSIREWIQIIVSEDSISRQAAIDAIKEIHPVDTEYDCTLYDKLDVMYVLKDIPPVNPQPKTGYWIKISPAGIYECSECGQNVMTSDICAYKFCHGCGAKMVEPQEREG